jgi:hypothetical protein
MKHVIRNFLSAHLAMPCWWEENVKNKTKFPNLGPCMKLIFVKRSGMLEKSASEPQHAT